MSRIPSRARALLMTAALLAGSILLAALPATTFAAGTVSHYVFTPSPIAPAGSLAANATKSVTVSAETSTNTLVPGAVIYLSFTQATGGGSASVGTTALSHTPAPFTASTGSITVTYKTPAVLPTTGRDVIKAANLASLATISTYDSYSFAKPVASNKILLAPTPIAPAGTLAANATVTVTLTGENSSSVPVPAMTVYLSFVRASGGGTALVGTKALTTTPTAFVVNSSGQLFITYKTPATLPTTGFDRIVAQLSATSTTSKSDYYAFGMLKTLTFSPSPIAATGALKAGSKVTVTLTAKDGSGAIIPGAYVYLTFAQAAGGGSAMVGTKLLAATPTRFTTNISGQIVITYSTGTSVPTTGSDKITAANLLKLPTITASDGYTF